MSVLQFPRKADPLEQALIESLNRFDASLKMGSTPARIQADVGIAKLSRALAKAGLTFTCVDGAILIHTIRNGVL